MAKRVSLVMNFDVSNDMKVLLASVNTKKMARALGNTTAQAVGSVGKKMSTRIVDTEPIKIRSGRVPKRIGRVPLTNTGVYYSIGAHKGRTRFYFFTNQWYGKKITYQVKSAMAERFRSMLMPSLGTPVTEALTKYLKRNGFR